MNYFIIDENKIVQNAIMWDGDTVNNPYPVPQGWQIKQSDIGGIGWTYDGKNFIPPAPPQDAPADPLPSA